MAELGSGRARKAAVLLGGALLATVALADSTDGIGRYVPALILVVAGLLVFGLAPSPIGADAEAAVREREADAADPRDAERRGPWPLPPRAGT